MTIAEIVEKIRTAIYGKDVREYIAKGIESINTVATDADEKAQSVYDDAEAGEFRPKYNFAGEWSDNNVTYTKNVDIVSSNDYLYACTETHTTHYGTQNIPGSQGSSWQRFYGSLDIDEREATITWDSADMTGMVAYNSTVSKLKKYGKIVQISAVFKVTTAGKTFLVDRNFIPVNYRGSDFVLLNCTNDDRGYGIAFYDIEDNVLRIDFSENLSVDQKIYLSGMWMTED